MFAALADVAIVRVLGLLLLNLATINAKHNFTCHVTSDCRIPSDHDLPAPSMRSLAESKTPPGLPFMHHKPSSILLRIALFHSQPLLAHHR